MDAQEFRKSAQAAVDQITTYFDNLANSKLPVLPNIQPGYLAPRLPKSAPEEPESWLENIPSDIGKHIIPGVTHWQHPNFHAFFPACTTYPSILAEMYSSAFTGPAFNWLCSPACTELETVVLDWMCKALALPECFLSTGSTGGGGVIQGSASEAVVTCMVAARERAATNICRKEGLTEGSEEWDDKVAELRAKLVALSSDQAHSSTAKGARIAGTRYRSVPTKWEDDLTLKVAILENQLEECVRKGWIPYYITLTLGTTSTCAVDPFQEITTMLKAKYPEVWIHVDAAYAGTALICEELRTKDYNPRLTLPSLQSNTNRHAEVVNGNGASANTATSDMRTLDTDFGMVDSFNTNMHKWLLTSFDASLLYVRDRNDLISAMSISPTYLQNKHTDSGLVTDYRDWQIPLGRRFRALKIWFVIRTYGMQGLRAHIRKGVRLGEFTEDLVQNDEAGKRLFELVSPTTYGLCCFRIRPEAIPAAMVAKRKAASQSDSSMNGAPIATVKQQVQAVEETIANELTKKAADMVNESGKAFLTSSATNGKTFIRIVSGNENANEESVRSVYNLCAEYSKQLLAEV